MKEIIVNSKKHGICVVLVDDEDYEYLSKFRWYINAYGYAERRQHKPNKNIKMHRQILGVLDKKGVDVDHINKNKLDNRKRNLRICSHEENMRNVNSRKNSASKYKGVFYHKKSEKWRSSIKFNGKEYFLGYFDTEEKAAKAYDQMARHLEKDNAEKFFSLNFPEINENIIDVEKIINRDDYLTSKIKGVYYNKFRRKWIAQDGSGKNRVVLGAFDFEADAIEAKKSHMKNKSGH